MSTTKKHINMNNMRLDTKKPIKPSHKHSLQSRHPASLLQADDDIYGVIFSSVAL